MPIPVPIPVGPRTITDAQSSLAEQILEVFLEIVEYGTTGSVVTTPPLVVSAGPNPPIDPSTGQPKVTPVALATADQQLFWRQFSVAIAGFITSSPGTGGLLITGQQAVNTSPVALPANAVSKIVLRSSAANTDRVWVGTSAAMTNADSFPLDPGDSITLDVNNTDLVWMFSVTGTQTIYWAATT